MAKDGRHDVRGRSTGSFSGRTGTLLRPPLGEPWIWLTAELLHSAAFQALSINARKLFDFLLVELVRHNRRENGKLLAPYDQLEAPPYGISRRLIPTALAELERGGFLVIVRKGRMDNGRRQPSDYRLTPYAVAEAMLKATNDWRRRTAEDVKNARKALLERKARRSDGRRPPNVLPLRRIQKPGAP